MEDKRSPMKISRNTPEEPEEIGGKKLDQVLCAQGTTITADDADISVRGQIAPVANAQRYMPLVGPKAVKDPTDRIPFKRNLSRLVVL